ncbi:hypothetical protein, partial [Vibrio sp. DNB22_19_1]
LITWVGQFYFGDNVDKWIKFKLALTLLRKPYTPHNEPLPDRLPYCASSVLKLSDCNQTS